MPSKKLPSEIAKDNLIVKALLEIKKQLARSFRYFKMRGYDGSEWQNLKTDEDGRLSVDINEVSTDVTFKIKGYDGSEWVDVSVDSDGVLQIDNPTVEIGGQDKSIIYNPDSKELLELILLELRKMNTHLTIITDNQIEDSDTE